MAQRGRPKKINEEDLPFHCTLDCKGEIYTSAGQTIFECLTKLSPTLIKNRSTLAVETQGKSIKTFLFPLQLRRMLVNKITKQILEKKLLTLLQ